MAKKIFVTDEDIEIFLRSSQERLLKESISMKQRRFQSSQGDSATVTFKMEIPSDSRKARLLFSLKAWAKMNSLISSYSSEIEWHGTVSRVDENSFIINDILVFPHEVTGTTVVSNQVEYEKWLNDLDDETFNSLRFHGHSHVNMAVTPSGVDLGYRKNILNNFGTPTDRSDYFYIFLILNKRGEISGEIYDLQNNALYESPDITTEVVFDDETTLAEFLADAKKMVKQAAYQYQQSSYGGWHWENGRYVQDVQPQKSSPPPQPVAPQPVASTPTKFSSANTETQPKQSSKPKLKKKAKTIARHQNSDYGYDYDDYYEEDWYKNMRGLKT